MKLLLGNMVNDGAMWYFRDHLGKDVDFALRMVEIFELNYDLET